MTSAVARSFRLADGVAAPVVPLPVLGSRDAVVRRIVGLATVLGGAALLILMGLAVFHSVLADGQYRLSRLERDINAERQRMVELQYELETLNTPMEVELMAEGILGLVSASEPIDISVSTTFIAATARVDAEVFDDGGVDWMSMKSLLTGN